MVTGKRTVGISSNYFEKIKLEHFQPMKTKR